MTNYMQILRATFSQEVSDNALERLVASARIVTFPAKVKICRQGELAGAMYILLEGSVGVYSEIEDDMYHIDTIRHGTFGEIGVLLNLPRTAFIITKEETTVIEITGAEFNTFVKDHPEVAADITKMVLRRLTEQEKRNSMRFKARYDSPKSTVFNKINDNNMDNILYTWPIERLAYVYFSRTSILGGPRIESQYQTDIFMVMPFQDSLQPVYEVIKSVAFQLNLVIKRGDDVFSNNLILGEIWSVCFNARLVIADCTAKNANVFYELGMAHTLGRKTIMLTQNPEDIPFDLRNFRYIRYELSAAGMVKLMGELREAITKLLS